MSDDHKNGKLTEAELTELLDWVSACQSAYHIETTPNHRFGGLITNLSENREGLIAYVNDLLESRATQPPQDERGQSDDALLAREMYERMEHSQPQDERRQELSHEFAVRLSEYGVAMAHRQGEKARVLAEVLQSMFDAEPEQPVALPTLTADRALNALRALVGNPEDPNIGWLRNGKTSKDHFRCEHCGVEDLDCSKIAHLPTCPIPEAISVAASAPAQQAGQTYAKCYVCDRPMDGTSEDDCHCFHRKELAAPAPEGKPYEAWFDPASCKFCGMVGGHAETCRNATTPQPVAAEVVKDERAAFEAQFPQFDLRPSIHVGHYADLKAEFMWRAWQARAILAAAQGTELADLRQALHDAATSLETVSRLGGRDEHMKCMLQVRGYAHDRAKVAFAAISGTGSDESKKGDNNG